jgi:hypothetical protein
MMEHPRACDGQAQLDSGEETRSRVPRTVLNNLTMAGIRLRQAQDSHQSR